MTYYILDAKSYVGISHFRHRKEQVVGVIVGIIARGAVECLVLFGQRHEVNSFLVSFHLAETDRFRQLVNGDNVNLVLPLAIPPIPYIFPFNAIATIQKFESTSWSPLNTPDFGHFAPLCVGSAPESESGTKRTPGRSWGGDSRARPPDAP